VKRASKTPERTKRPALEKILFIPDTHAPYHDTQAFALLVKFAKWWKPTHVYILGDFVDMYSVSSHSKDPTRARNLESEIMSACDLLDDLEGIGTHRTYIMGNHEQPF